MYRSRTSTHGRNMAGARGLWRATGMKDSDLANQSSRSSIHLRNLFQVTCT